MRYFVLINSARTRSRLAMCNVEHGPFDSPEEAGEWVRESPFTVDEVKIILRPRYTDAELERLARLAS